MPTTASAEEFFGAGSPFGAIPGWVAQDGGGVTKTKERASVLGADGDEARHVDRNEQHSTSCVYIPDDSVTGGSFVLTPVGGLLNGYVIDSVSLVYSQDVPKLTVTGHKAVLKTANAYASLRTYSPTIDLPFVALGVPDALGHVSCNGARSATYTLACTHVSETGGQGYLVGANNHDGTETLTIESVCAITLDADDDDAASWTATNDARTKSNSAATVNSLTLVKHIAHDTGSGS